MADAKQVRPIDQPFSSNPAELPRIIERRGRPAHWLDMSHEQLRINEIYVSLDGKRMEKVRKVVALMQRRYDVVLTEDQVMGCLRGLAPQKYRERLKRRGKDAQLRAMSRKLPRVREVYDWSLEAAHEQGDYKVAGDRAAEYLDRLGVTLKKEQAVQPVQVVVLRGKNFDLGTLDKPTPQIETAEIEETDDGNG